MKPHHDKVPDQSQACQWQPSGNVNPKVVCNHDSAALWVKEKEVHAIQSL